MKKWNDEASSTPLEDIKSTLNSMWENYGLPHRHILRPKANTLDTYYCIECFGQFTLKNGEMKQIK